MILDELFAKEINNKFQGPGGGEDRNNRLLWVLLIIMRLCWHNPDNFLTWRLWGLIDREKKKNWILSASIAPFARNYGDYYLQIFAILLRRLFWTNFLCELVFYVWYSAALLLKNFARAVFLCIACLVKTENDLNEFSFWQDG